MADTVAIAAPRRRDRWRAFQQLTAAERAQLDRWVRAPTSPHRLVVRSRIVLLADDGFRTAAIAAHLRISPATVRLWCRRVQADGVGVLERDAPGRGRPPGMSREKVAATFRALRQFVEDGVPWSARAVADWARVSPATVWRIARKYGLTRASTRADVDRARRQAITETRRSVANGLALHSHPAQSAPEIN